MATVTAFALMVLPEVRTARFLFFSFSTLGATALRLGKSRQHSPSRLITNCLATVITTKNNATCAVTLDSPVQKLSKSQKDRYAPPHISVMAC